MNFKLHLIETITNNFSEDQKVGSGGYGDVYKAVHNGEEIAVKKLHPLKGLDDKQFDNEFRNLSKICHKNVVCESWKKRLLVKPGYSSHEIDILQVGTCAEIALRCVDKDREKRPCVLDIVQELEELEAKVTKMSLTSHLSKDLTVQRSCDSNVIAVDPTLELRFLFEPRKEVSCCLQLTNKTDGFIAFNVKINQNKYRARPSKGTMPPCSKRYIVVTMEAQANEPPNMRCHDMLLVQSTFVSQDLASEETEIDYQELLNTTLTKNVVDVQLPIVYVILDL